MERLEQLTAGYIKIGEAAERFGVSARRVQALCAKGRIAGAVQVGREWLIPADTKKPADGRTRAERSAGEENMPLPRKTPFLSMTDLYRTAGKADEVARTLADNHEAQVLFEAFVAYARGEIDRVYEKASYLLGKHSGFYAILSAGMLLAQCAIWQGDIAMWRRAKIHIAEAPAKSDIDRDVMLLSISAVDIMLYSVDSFPAWFKSGCFAPLPDDALPAASVYYAKYLYAAAYAVATGSHRLEGVERLSLMSMIPATLEPLISWVRAGKTIMAEIYLRLTCATAYHLSGNDGEACRHIDRALALALPDRLYGVLAEYCRALDTLMEKRLSPLDGAAWAQVKQLYKTYGEGWARLSGHVRGRTVVTTLTPKQREIAKLAAFGLSNREIAEKLDMSLAGVKQALLAITDKLGVGRDRFAAFL